MVYDCHNTVKHDNHNVSRRSATYSTDIMVYDCHYDKHNDHDIQ